MPRQSSKWVRGLLPLLLAAAGQTALAAPSATSVPYGRVSATAGGTGGISVDGSDGTWGAPTTGTPHVTIRSDGFTIRTAAGATLTVPSDSPDRDRFLRLWLDIHHPKNGYFSPHDIPYHSVETLIVEAPDYGHVSTSETFSYWTWLEAMFGHYAADYSLLRYAFNRIETYAIPSYQNGVGAYTPNTPATYAAEQDLPSAYPVVLEQGPRPGQDPIAQELQAAYGAPVYGMHWLIDATNWYGYGVGNEPVYVNTFQRGPQESVWETVPHPAIEEFQFGAPQQGFLSLFTADPNGYKRQWRYTTAPDADARVVQSIYWAKEFATAQGNPGAVDDLIAKATKMGDYLRYAMFDKYFKTIGCQQAYCNPGSGESSAHYLLGWYYAWGGSHPSDYGSWSWRSGGSHAHIGYQNPVAALAMANDPAFRSKTPGGTRMWAQSLQRQLEFFRWLQADSGALAAGATSSFRGRYAAYPQGKATFYGLAFETNPVFEDPGSGTWFGWQAWSMQRVAEYYLQTGDRQVENLLDRWVGWAAANTKLPTKDTFAVPSTLAWTGEPDTWNPAAPSLNRSLAVTVVDHTQDVGVAASLAKTLLYYAKATQAHRGQPAPSATLLARALLDRLWQNYRDDKGISVVETRTDYVRFNDQVPVPGNFRGKLPNGATVDAQSTFLSLRPQYRIDPDFPRVQTYLQGGAAPQFRYHRFWAAAEAALAYAELDRLEAP